MARDEHRRRGDRQEGDAEQYALQHTPRRRHVPDGDPGERDDVAGALGLVVEEHHIDQRRRQQLQTKLPDVPPFCVARDRQEKNAEPKQLDGNVGDVVEPRYAVDESHDGIHMRGSVHLLDGQPRVVLRPQHRRRSDDERQQQHCTKYGAHGGRGAPAAARRKGEYAREDRKDLDRRTRGDP